MKKEDVDLANAVVWIPDSKTPTGVAEVPLTEFAVEAFRSQIADRGSGALPVSQPRQPVGLSGQLQEGLGDDASEGGSCRTSGFTISDRRMRLGLSAGGVADEWVTQLLRQGDAKVFKKYSQMKLQMKREALAKLNRKANDKGSSGTGEAA